jgi:hypothetical protein
MKRLRITGLVGLAKRVRQELAGPVSPKRLAQLREEVAQTIASIERILREERVRVQSLPAPSRKAFAFLKGLDWDTVATEESLFTGHRPPESVAFRGLPRYFRNLLDRLARVAPSCPDIAPPSSAENHSLTPKAGVLPGRACDRELQEVYETIASDSVNIEKEIRSKNIRPEQLKRQARELRGWFAYFARRENFDRYCAAVRRAEPVFRATCPWPTRQAITVLVHFQPMQGLYRVRGSRETILVDLPTPMICFDQNTLRAVARIAFKKGGDRKAVHDAAAGEAHRRIDAALELLGGVVDQTRGLHHDLAESFDRVNAEYFGRSMSRPRLVWSRSFATRKYGHYDHARDTVMINAALDRATVPEYAVDLVVYHELLHRQLGITWKHNRIAAHTPELAAKERQFKQYDQAKSVLRKLASER